MVECSCLVGPILGKVAGKCVADQPELNYVMTRKMWICKR